MIVRRLAAVLALLAVACESAASGDAGSGDPGAHRSGRTDAGAGDVEGTSTVQLRQMAEVASVEALPDPVLALGKPVLQGSTILVLVTEFLDNGAVDPVTLKDSQGSSAYDKLQTVSDVEDIMAVMLFARYDVAAGAFSVHADFIAGEWQGLIVVEVAGVPAAPYLASASNFQQWEAADETRPVADELTSGKMTASSAAGVFLVGFGVNCRDANAGAPKAGTGFTALGTGWNWKGAEGTTHDPTALVESKRVTSGTFAATLTRAAFADNFATFGIALSH